MIKLGAFNTLKILRATSVGMFLGDEEVDDLLLPSKYIPEQAKIGDEIEVFCYLDHQERPIATTQKPLVLRDEFAFLRVADVTEIGAFVDWGLEKHLFVPFREQRTPLKKDTCHVIHCCLDEKSFRLVGSTRVNKFLSNEQLTVEPGDKVALLVSGKTPLGWDVIVNNKHRGLIYANEVFRDLSVGDALNGFVKQLRPDNKLDISLQQIGYQSVGPAAQQILDQLHRQDGFLNLHDKSAPTAITAQFQMSKKMFKKAIGALYRERKILIKEDGIYLTEQTK